MAARWYPASFGRSCELPFWWRRDKVRNQARFHPLKFLAGIAEEIEVYEQTKVLKGDREWRLHWEPLQQSILYLRHISIYQRTGYYFARMYQERSYVTALEGAGRPEGMYLELTPDGLSIRPCRDFAAAGGGSHRTGLNQGTAGAGCRYEFLRRKRRKSIRGQGSA